MLDQRARNSLEASAAKAKAGKVASQVCQNCVAILGPLGYSCDVTDDDSTQCVPTSGTCACTAETLKESHRFATSRERMWQVHAAQSITEFHEMTQRHGRTPVQWLHDLGVLGPGRVKVPGRIACVEIVRL